MSETNMQPATGSVEEDTQLVAKAIRGLLEELDISDELTRSVRANMRVSAERFHPNYTSERITRSMIDMVYGYLAAMKAEADPYADDEYDWLDQIISEQAAGLKVSPGFWQYVCTITRAEAKEHHPDWSAKRLAGCSMDMMYGYFLHMEDEQAARERETNANA